MLAEHKASVEKDTAFFKQTANEFVDYVHNRVNGDRDNLLVINALAKWEDLFWQSFDGKIDASFPEEALRKLFEIVRIIAEEKSCSPPPPEAA